VAGLSAAGIRIVPAGTALTLAAVSVVVAAALTLAAVSVVVAAALVLAGVAVVIAGAVMVGVSSLAFGC